MKRAAAVIALYVAAVLLAHTTAPHPAYSSPPDTHTTRVDTYEKSTP